MSAHTPEEIRAAAQARRTASAAQLVQPQVDPKWPYLGRFQMPDSGLHVDVFGEIDDGYIEIAHVTVAGTLVDLYFDLGKHTIDYLTGVVERAILRGHDDVDEPFEPEPAGTPVPQHAPWFGVEPR